jgi:hypothetical protein
MPSIERSSSISITFTDAAELALQQALRRLERDLRARAIDDAVRTRGVPAEVTSTDVNRAYSETRNVSRIVTRRTPYLDDPDLPPHVREQLYLQHIIRAEGSSEEHRKSASERLARAYIIFGAIVGSLGVLFPPLYKLGRGLLSEPIWRLGLATSAIGILTALLGVGFQSYLQSRAAELARKRASLIATGIREDKDEDKRRATPHDAVVRGPTIS